MSKDNADMPVTLEGDEPCELYSVRFGRHPADANVTVGLPRLDMQVNFSLAPGVYMTKEFLDNYLYYTCVVISKRELAKDEAANAVLAAAEFIGFNHVLPVAEIDGQTAEVCVLCSDAIPRALEAEARGIFHTAVLLVVQADPEAFQQAVHVAKIAGLAAMAGGRLSDRAESSDDAGKQQNLGRRLSDAMPPNDSKH